MSVKLNNMKQKNIINLLKSIIFVVLIIANTNFVFAAPAPHRFVINEKTKQSGIYWAGDEFTQYELPDGWKIYEPITILTQKTPFGTCVGETTYKGDEQYYQNCAKQIGLKYVDYKNVAYTSSEVSKFNESGWKCTPKAGKDYSNGFLLNEKDKEITTLIDFTLSKPNETAYPTEGQCVIEDTRWVAYENSGVSEGRIVTPFGMCNDSTYTYDNYETCSKQLGLTYVGSDLEKAVVTENTVSKNYLLPIIVSIFFIIISIIGLVIFKKFWKSNNLPPNLKDPNSQPIIDNDKLEQTDPKE